MINLMKYAAVYIVFTHLLERAIERFVAMVDLPTPPFPEATSKMFFTPAIGSFFGSPLDKL